MMLVKKIIESEFLAIEKNAFVFFPRCINRDVVVLASTSRGKLDCANKSNPLFSTSPTLN